MSTPGKLSATDLQACVHGVIQQLLYLDQLSFVPQFHFLKELRHFADGLIRRACFSVVKLSSR